mgnify:CR=1 FL=1
MVAPGSRVLDVGAGDRRELVGNAAARRMARNRTIAKVHMVCDPHLTRTYDIVPGGN